MGCTYRSNSTRSGDEVSGYWINPGFPSSSIVWFSHSCIKYQTAESLSLTASAGDAVLKRTHRKKKKPHEQLLNWINVFVMVTPRSRAILPSKLFPHPFALQANKKSVASCIGGKGNTNTVHALCEITGVHKKSLHHDKRPLLGSSVTMTNRLRGTGMEENAKYYHLPLIGLNPYL